jgi:hypothetical protein
LAIRQPSVAPNGQTSEEVDGGTIDRTHCSDESPRERFLQHRHAIEANASTLGNRQCRHSTQCFPGFQPSHYGVVVDVLCDLLHVVQEGVHQLRVTPRIERQSTASRVDSEPSVHNVERTLGQLGTRISV